MAHGYGPLHNPRAEAGAEHRRVSTQSTPWHLRTNHESTHQKERRSEEVQQMKAVAVKKGQGYAEAARFQEMGTLRCDLCGEEFLIRHHPAFVDTKSAEGRRTGSRKCSPKSTSARRSTPTELSCRISCADSCEVSRSHAQKIDCVGDPPVFANFAEWPIADHQGRGI